MDIGRLEVTKKLRSAVARTYDCWKRITGHSREVISVARHQTKPLLNLKPLVGLGVNNEVE